MPKDEFGIPIVVGSRIAFRMDSPLVTGIVQEIDDGAVFGQQRLGKMRVSVDVFIAWDPKSSDNLRGAYLTMNQPPELDPDFSDGKGATTQ